MLKEAILFAALFVSVLRAKPVGENLASQSSSLASSLILRPRSGREFLLENVRNAPLRDGEIQQQGDFDFAVFYKTNLNRPPRFGRKEFIDQDDQTAYSVGNESTADDLERKLLEKQLKNLYDELEDDVLQEKGINNLGLFSRNEPQNEPQNRVWNRWTH